MAEGFVTVNGAQLWYEDSGGDGHAVLFTHAGVCDHRQWNTQMAPFAAKYRVIRYDMRGSGQSELPAGAASLSDDIGGLLDALGVERAALIGCSMGGSSSLDFTLKQPERVSALVLVGAGVSGDAPTLGPGEQELIAEIEAADEAHDNERLNDAETRLWLYGPNRAPEQVASDVRALFTDMNGNNIRRGPEWEGVEMQPLDPPAIGRLSEVHTPTLVIVGGDDTFHTRKTADTLESSVAGARKVVMPGLTHVPNMERPDEFNQLVLDFLAPIW